MQQTIYKFTVFIRQSNIVLSICSYLYPVMHCVTVFLFFPRILYIFVYKESSFFLSVILFFLFHCDLSAWTNIMIIYFYLFPSCGIWWIVDGQWGHTCMCMYIFVSFVYGIIFFHSAFCVHLYVQCVQYIHYFFFSFFRL